MTEDTRQRLGRNISHVNGIAAFFDLDLTLLTVNSGILWLKRERRLGRISHAKLWEAAMYMAAYRLGVMNIETATRRLLETYRDTSEEDLAAAVTDWFEDEIADKLAPRAVEALLHHRQQGHRLVLLSSTSAYLARAAAEFYGLDDWISSRYAVRDGLFAGEPVLPLCYGQGKVVLAERYAHQHAIDLRRSYFYADSSTDVPMFLRVGYPHVVNPDVRLRLYARWRGWPILKWTSTAT